MVVALRAEGFAPVAAADADDLSLDAVLAAAGSIGADIVLLDLYLGKSQLGIPMIGPLVAQGAKVLLFTASTDPYLIASGLRAGAEAVVDKSMPFPNVVGTLNAVAAGEELMPPHERDALIEALEQHVAEEHARLRSFDALTEREAHVLRSLIAGRSPKQVARDSGTSVSTVRGHIEHIFQKLGVGTQREAFAAARTAGWPDTGGPAGTPA